MLSFSLFGPEVIPLVEFAFVICGLQYLREIIAETHSRALVLSKVIIDSRAKDETVPILGRKGRLNGGVVQGVKFLLQS